jgi:RHS repeat-associated protein
MKTIDSPYADHATERSQGFASQRQASAVRTSRQARSPFQLPWRALVLLLCAFVFSPQAWALSCDIDNDSDIDLQDLTLIQQAILGRATVSGPDDPRDVDGNDIINSIDGRLCALRCTRARCSVTNSPPVANAGPDQRVTRGSLVALDGSASRDPEGAPLNLAWLLVGQPPGSAALMAGSSSSNPSFTADLAGDYVVQLIVHDGQLASAPDMVTISASNTPPTITMMAPLPNQRFTAPATMIVSADATDSGGQITAVAFYQGDTPIGTVSSAPYRITWSPIPAGSYVLKASATDDDGATSWSDAVSITVTNDTGVRVYYLHNDHLNTPRMVSDEANRVVWRNSPLTEPFGMSPPEEDPDGDGQAFTLNLRFPGQYADWESNLHYNYFRDYDPETGRYWQSDPIGLAGGVNTYVYGNGNPPTYSDPLGLWVFGVYNNATRQLSINDLETGQSISGPFSSGGRPFGAPIPNGIYDVVQHPDFDFYRLEPVDDSYGDDTSDRTNRNNFRLHRPGRTFGCIAAEDADNWRKVRDLIRKTETDNVTVRSKSRRPWASSTELLIRYGRIVVINSN